MNSNGDYTICNLDNHTYTSNYNQDSISTSGYSSYVHNNGIGVDTGQLGYGASAAALHHGGGDPGPLTGPNSTGPHGGPPNLYPGSVLGAGSPAPGHGGYPGIPHHGSTCMTGPTPHPGSPYADYYPGHPGVITNGGLDCTTAGPGGYYPHHDPNGPPCISTSGYGLPNHHHSQGQGSPNQDQTPVATYKWMTVKRAVPKAQSEYVFSTCFISSHLLTDFYSLWPFAFTDQI